jgi:putative holliday junction resolvase
MRTLAIDLGTKRVGLALSDEGGQYATPLDVLIVTSPEQALAQVLVVIVKEGVERIVLGLPLNMDDSVGPAARAALAWGQALARQSGKAVLYVDERLSSFAAEQSLLDRKKAGERLTRQRKREQLDAIAAATFLRQFLEGQLQPLSKEWVASHTTVADNW